MNITHFANPQYLWFLTILIPMIGYYVFRTRQGGATIQISTISTLKGVNRTYKYYLRHAPFALRCIAVALLIVALARPQTSEYGNNSTTEGIDIVLALDVSGSMLARDFKPDRISSAKEVASKFIVDRPTDRMGLVIFAGESFTQCPLTTDKRSLQNLLSQVESGILEDGTAIGNGLATSVNRLKESDAKSKVVILLTDGVNNSGQIAPLTAAEIAKTYGIRVYTIGVGSMGTAPYPAIDVWGNMSFIPMKVEIDEGILTQIAEQTGGEYFRATDEDKLRKVYDRINELERTKIETNDFVNYEELFIWYVIAALILLVCEQVLRQFVLKSIP